MWVVTALTMVATFPAEGQTSLWRVVTEQSEIRIVRADGSEELGRFDRFEGTVHVGPDEGTIRRVFLRIDTTSFQAESPSMGRTLSVWMRSDRIPTAIYDSTHVARKGRHWLLIGNLWFRGEVRNLVLVEVMRAGKSGDPHTGKQQVKASCRLDFGGSGITSARWTPIRVEATLLLEATNRPAWERPDT